MGCSDQSVPSLSNVAMRSGTGTKSGVPGFVTRETKPVIACFAAPSFHEGSGSTATGALAGVSAGDGAGAGVELDGEERRLARQRARLGDEVGRERGGHRGVGTRIVGADRQHASGDGDGAPVRPRALGARGAGARRVDEQLGTGGAVTFGVRSLASIRDVILAALPRGSGG